MNNTKYSSDFNQDGGSLAGILGWEEDTGVITKGLDMVQLLLDVAAPILDVCEFATAGLCLAVAEPVEGANLILSILRGNFHDAMYGLIEMIPFVGGFIGTPGKYMRKYRKWKRRAEIVDDFA